MINIENFPDQSTINRLLNSFTQTHVSELEEIHWELFRKCGSVYQSKEKIRIDIDGTGISVSGKNFEFARKGYFPGQRGKSGYKITAASIPCFKGSELLYFTLDSGNVPASSRFKDMLDKILEKIDKEKIEFIRMDREFGYGELIDGIIKRQLKFITKAKNPKTCLKWINENIEWEKVSDTTLCYDIGLSEIPNSKNKTRVVLLKKKVKKGIQYDAILTNITDKKAKEIVEMYNGRQKIEAFFKEDKNCLGLKYLKVKKYDGIHSFLWFGFMVNNLLLWFRKYVLCRTPLEKLGFKSLYNVLQDMYVRFIKKDEGWELEFIYYTELQKVFIDRTIKWLMNVIPKGILNSGGKNRRLSFEGVVHSYLLFYVLLSVLGDFNYAEEEQKESVISKLRLLFAES